LIAGILLSLDSFLILVELSSVLLVLLFSEGFLMISFLVFDFLLVISLLLLLGLKLEIAAIFGN